MKPIIIATDGSAINNPHGPAGWAWYIDEQRWSYGGLSKGSNQATEILAIYRAVASLPINVPLLILTDSKFWVNALGEDGKSGWHVSWKRSGWLKKDGQRPANLKIIQAFSALMTKRHAPIKLEWVRGHNNHELNEKADTLATLASYAVKTEQLLLPSPGFIQRSPLNPIQRIPTSADLALFGQGKDPYALLSSPAPLGQAKPNHKSGARVPAKRAPSSVSSSARTPAKKAKNAGKVQVARLTPAQAAELRRKQGSAKAGGKLGGELKTRVGVSSDSNRAKLYQANQSARRSATPTPTRRRRKVDNSVITSFHDDNAPIPTVGGTKTSEARLGCDSCGGFIDPVTSQCRCFKD